MRIAIIGTVLGMTFVAGATSASAAPLPREAPRIVSLRTLDAPEAGRPVRVEVKVRDPLAAINGIQADFGDGRGAIKNSACRPGTNLAAPFRPNDMVTFVVTHAYLLPGVYDLSFVATSGDCVIGPLAAHRRLRLRVRVPNPLERAKPTALARAAATACAGAHLLPARATLRASARTALCLANHLRQLRGRGALRSNRRLRVAAERHARDMVARDYFAHESPTGVDLRTRLRRARYRQREAGENIGAGQDALASPLAVVIAWMESPPHRVNLLEDRFDEAGVGVAMGFPGGGGGATYTMDFGRR